MTWFVPAILILVLALVLQLSMLAYAMYALLAVILLSRYLTRRWAESLYAAREVSRVEAEIGDRVAIVVTITNQGKWPIPWVLLEDLLPLQALIHRPPNLQITGRRVLLTTLRPGGTKRLMYQLQCNRRGYYQLGPLVMETGDLFGLHRRYRMASAPQFLMVYPANVPLSGYDVASRRPIGEVRMTYRLFEDPTRNAGVRRYQPGDPMNRVHWPATARTGVLHSKVYDPSTVAGATILLDFHRDSYPPRNEPFRSELAVTAAVSLAHAIFEMGQQVGLITNGRDAADRIQQEGWSYDMRTRDAARRAASMMPHSQRLRPQVVETRRGVEQWIRIRETLARVELTDGMNFVALVAETTCRMPRDATVVAILQEVTDEFAIALGNVRRHGFAVTAILSIHESYDFAEASRHLLAEGISTHQLRDHESIADIARAQLMGQLLRGAD